MSFFYIASIVILALNTLGFCLAYFRQTDHLTDITYALSFFSAVAIPAIFSEQLSVAQYFLVAMISIWAVRLGSYLFIRINKMKKDDRFDEMRPSLFHFARFWVLQAITVILVSAPSLLFLSQSNTEWKMSMTIGAGIWLLGFCAETLADYQKYSFRNKARNKGKFIQSGLWYFLQYPNYSGEILCWLGVSVFVFPYLSGFAYLSYLGTAWIVFLLVFVSGIPFLKKSALKKYGNQDAYHKYTKKTARLIPFVY